MNVPLTRILAAGSLVLLAACSQTTPNAGPSVPDITTSSPSASAPLPETPSDTPAQSPTSEAAGAPAPPPQQATGGVGECKAADLSLSLGQGDAAAGTVYRPIIFSNKSGRTCTMQGFPGVSYVTGDDGHQVGPAAERVGAKGPVITLAPNGRAQAPVGFVQVRNFDTNVCRPTETRGLRIYPPHDTASMFLPLPGTGCAGNPPGQQLSVKTMEKI
ncbi:DUF4232 domain-containing protein [Actinocrispum sp. NPDC049592]|uniref:DUF4232 domain-containing protein n=1 Tax=Actinocrispum sp. NPDC049592 TaxID=3154835 RepID=UPI00342A02E4